MAKPASNKKLNAKPTAQASLRGGPNWPLFVLALLGMAVSAYLTYSSWQGKLVAGCTVGSGCVVVLNSRWSTLFGMPTSFWGFLTYALLAAIAWNKRAAQQWKWAWVVSIFVLLYSLYLTSISLFVLHAAGPSAPQADVCKEKNIQSYPTWIINGERYTSIQPLDSLAQISKYNAQRSKP